MTDVTCTVEDFPACKSVQWHSTEAIYWDIINSMQHMTKSCRLKWRKTRKYLLNHVQNEGILNILLYGLKKLCNFCIKMHKLSAIASLHHIFLESMWPFYHIQSRHVEFLPLILQSLIVCTRRAKPCYSLHRLKLNQLLIHIFSKKTYTVKKIW